MAAATSVSRLPCDARHDTACLSTRAGCEGECVGDTRHDCDFIAPRDGSGHHSAGRSLIVSGGFLCLVVMPWIVRSNFASDAGLGWCCGLSPECFPCNLRNPRSDSTEE